jgi:hypothetical protein
VQKLELKSYDDLYAAAGDLVVTDQPTVELSFGRRTVLLDLTAENYRVLAEFLEPYLKAGRDGREPVAPGSAGDIVAGRKVGQAMRDFGDAADDPKVYYRKGESGSYYYSRELRKQFAARAAQADPAPAGDRRPAVS